VSVSSSLPDQPLPTRSPRSVDVAPLVIADIEARIRKGIETYGQPLRTHNGRDPLWDAYEEQIDRLLYSRQAIEEIKDLRAEIATLRSALGVPSTPAEPACTGPYRYEPECQACPTFGVCWAAAYSVTRQEERA
jgi:hypothetical protein